MTFQRVIFGKPNLVSASCQYDWKLEMEKTNMIEKRLKCKGMFGKVGGRMFGQVGSTNQPVLTTYTHRRQS